MTHCFSQFALFWLAVLYLATGSAMAQKVPNGVDVQVQPAFEQLESDAIAFVTEHHPELVSLLQSLKSMRQKEYEIAIREIVRTKKRLEALANREPALHAMELDAWKLKSKIDLLMARGIAGDKSFDKAVLRDLISQRLENQKKRWRHEQTTLSRRQEQLAELLSRTEGSENDKVEQELSTHLKHVDAKIGKTKKSMQDAKSTKEDKTNP